MSAREMKNNFWGFKPRHIILLLIVFLALIIGLYISAITSEAYENAINFAKTDPEIINRIGPVSKVQFKFWDGFDMSDSGRSGEATFVLGLHGSMGDATLDIRMKGIANSWSVDEAFLSTKKEKIRIHPKSSY